MCKNNTFVCFHLKGNHVIKNDFTVCPGCQFPAIYSEMMRAILFFHQFFLYSFIENNDDPSCPMCSSKLSRDSVRRVVDPSKIINAWITADDDALLSAGQETE
ncbi:uncharacterized protein DEA37_0009431 [Paragonimus westermani]|uniref:Uncharacterized protein n=1 Tax=Paragonimus westermani TaxID=34504 RepID=A0A5J4NL86_9TREM|nr:uncharacterized protein DEA37_0009431 [Paragonimus westermani]